MLHYHTHSSANGSFLLSSMTHPQRKAMINRVRRHSAKNGNFFEFCVPQIAITNISFGKIMLRTGKTQKRKSRCLGKSPRKRRQTTQKSRFLPFSSYFMHKAGNIGCRQVEDGRKRASRRFTTVSTLLQQASSHEPKRPLQQASLCNPRRATAAGRPAA